MGISIKRAKYFILCNGKYFTNTNIFKKKIIENNLIMEDKVVPFKGIQLALFNE